MLTSCTRKSRAIKYFKKVSSMISSAIPIVSPVAAITIYIFTWYMFCFVIFWKIGIVRKNSDHYRPWLWVGRVDQKLTAFGSLRLWDRSTLFPTFGDALAAAESLWIIKRSSISIKVATYYIHVYTYTKVALPFSLPCSWKEKNQGLCS